MTVHEIRETIQTLASSDDGQLIVQKKINLQPGKRHTFLHMDWFDDNISGATNTANNMKMQVYVTNYPLILSDDIFHSGLTGNIGPLAGDDQVLFKAVRLSWAGGNARWYNAEFPNNFLGATETFSWYTPQLYFTIVWQQGDGEISREFAQSFYAAVDSVDVDPVEYGIGLLREYNANQMRLLTSNGRLVTQAEVEGAMPMWQIGGIRPERMADPNDIIFGSEWFMGTGIGIDAGEALSSAAVIRLGLAEARTMQPYDTAFGGDTGGVQTPDWFKAIAAPFPGLASGPVRANFPPLLKNANGNTEMN